LAQVSIQTFSCPDAARFTPSHKLRQIDPAVRRLGIVNPGLGSLEKGSKVALRQAGFFPQMPEQVRNGRIIPFMLGFFGHMLAHTATGFV
jgi:hypothetical protein